MKELIVRPRRTGKTTNLIQQYYKSNDETKVVISPFAQHQNFSATVHHYKSSSYMRNIKGMIKPKSFFIDEYESCCLDFKKYIFHLAYDITIHIYAVTTPKVLFDRYLYNVTSEYHKARYKLMTEILKPEQEIIDLVGEELFYDLSTHPNVTTDFHTDNHISDEQYQTEVLGRMFK